MRTLVAATALFFSTASMANDCNMNLHGEMELSHGQLTLHLPDDKLLHLDGHKALLNGQEMHLSHAQLNMLNQYHQNVNDLAPKVAGIALDAVALANEGVAKAFNQLLGEDNELVADLSSEIDALRIKLHQEFYADDGSIRFNSANFDNGQFLGEDFESEFEQKLEKLVQRSMGSLMIAIGKEMLFSGGDMQAFEKRMDRFGEQLEADMEVRAAGIEAQAQTLCYDLSQLDSLENQISSSIPQLSGLNMIEVSESKYSM